MVFFCLQMFVCIIYGISCSTLALIFRKVISIDKDILLCKCPSLIVLFSRLLSFQPHLNVVDANNRSP